MLVTLGAEALALAEKATPELEDVAASRLGLLRRTRDAAGEAGRTRMWSFAVEQAD